MLWVPGHQKLEGNEKTNECAVSELFLEETMACNNILASLLALGYTIGHLGKLDT